LEEEKKAKPDSPTLPSHTHQPVASVAIKSEKKHEPSALTKITIHTKNIVHSALAESKNQLRETLQNAESDIEEISATCAKAPQRTRGLLKRVWQSASKPIIIPGSKRLKKPRSKLQLFLIDTIRFGGTFALIFGVLFTAINYQSFYQIAKAELALGDDLQNEKALQDMVQSSDRNHITSTNGTIGSMRNVDDVRSFLPDVGPMEDRLIIPKLGKNVPIVRPSMEALMKEDWPKFEDDIQEALRDGVVHYPGSAKPGQAGNFFLTGHSSYYPWVSSKYKDVFARLGELGIGDTYSVFYGGDKHTYRIIEKKEVKPNNVTVLDQPTDKRLATLMTCTPVGTTLRRLILIAEEIDPQTNIALTVGEKVVDQTPRNLKLQVLPM
jgi:LPXTG-site transpeptidase (sortase) family protein